MRDDVIAGRPKYYEPPLLSVVRLFDGLLGTGSGNDDFPAEGGDEMTNNRRG